MKHNPVLTALLLLLCACTRKFDAPPETEIPDIKGNTTILNLKAMHTAGKMEKINSDVVIEGTVIGDDKSGNLYKEIVLQDGSSGIVVRLDGSSLFTTYPIGRKLYIRCKGLYLGDYNKLVQLGGGIDNSNPASPELAPIAANLFDQYMVKGTFNNPVVPRQVDISALTTNMLDTLQSTLIQLNNVEFAAGDTARAYADTSKVVSSVNLSVKSCNGGSITLRNSSYASFAGIAVPKGNGSLVAIYTVYGSTKQLNIRDTGDVQMNGTRCATVDQLMHMADIRALYKGTTVSMPAGTKIRGVVISDKDAKNMADNSVVIQEASNLPGLLLHFTGTPALAMGDAVEVSLSGTTLDVYQGSLQLNNIVPGNAVKTGIDSIVPRMVTAAQLNDDKNFAGWESTLVTLQQVTVSGGTSGHWKGNDVLTDASGAIAAFTRDQATFADTAYPTTALGSFTGIVQYTASAKVITCRNLRDIVAGPPVVAPVDTTHHSSGVLVLQSAPLLVNFDDLSSGLPAGVGVYTGASKTALGSAVNFSTGKVQWSNATGAFKNYASATGLTASGDQAAQEAAVNRALGIRQVGNTSTSFPGSDPGAAFVFVLENTTGKTNLQLSFLLQSLDDGSARSTTWMVDYATGDNPQSFTPVAITGNAVTGNKAFTSNSISVDFGNTLDNNSSRIWIRIVTLAAADGTGSRASTAIDDVQFSWK